MCLYQNYIYCAAYGANIVYKINTANASVTNFVNIIGPTGVCAYGNYIYIIKYYGSVVYQYDLSGSLINNSFVSGLSSAYGCRAINGFLYIYNVGNSNISKISCA